MTRECLFVEKSHEREREFRMTETKLCGGPVSNGICCPSGIGGERERERRRGITQLYQ